MSLVVLRHVGVELQLLCGLQDQAIVLLCRGNCIGHAKSCAPLSRSKYSAPACLLVDDTELIVTPMIRGLIRFHSVHVFALAFAFLVVLYVAVVAGGIVVCSSTWSPAVLRPMSSSATVLARVDVCRDRVGRAGRAISFLDVGVCLCPSPCLSRLASYCHHPHLFISS